MNRAFSKIWIIIIVLIILGGGVFTWWHFKAPKDETADWQTYTNEEYGFEIRYPKTLVSAIEQKSTSFIDSNDVNNLKIFLTILDKNVNEVVPKFPEVKEISIGGKTAEYYSLGEDNQLDKFYYLSLSNSRTLKIEAIITEYGSVTFNEQLKILNQMLSTFRFLE